MSTQLAADVDHVSWSDFLDTLRWGRGEHVSIIGQTGSGKSFLAETLLRQRQYVVSLVTKPKDSTLEKMLRGPDRFARIREWPPPAPPDLMPRVMLWPKWVDSRDTMKQAVVMRDALDGVFGENEWTVYVDELAYMVEILNLKGMLRLLWQQGRSLGVSLIGTTQRPAWVPLEMYSQATHLFIFAMPDKRDRERIGGIGRTDPELVRQIVRDLDEHVFLYLNTRTGQMLTSKVANK